MPTIGLGLLICLFPLQLLPSLDALAPLLRLRFQLLSLRRPDLQPNASLLMAITTITGPVGAMRHIAMLENCAPREHVNGEKRRSQAR